MYDLIYNFIYNSLLNTTSLNGFTYQVLGNTISMAEWLSHSLAITSIVLLFVLAICVCRWFFRLGAGLFRF